MKKIMYAGALLLTLCFGLVTYSCSDDDDVTDFKSFVQGTWNAELVSVVDYKPLPLRVASVPIMSCTRIVCRNINSCWVCRFCFIDTPNETNAFASLYHK